MEHVQTFQLKKKNHLWTKIQNIRVQSKKDKILKGCDPVNVLDCSETWKFHGRKKIYLRAVRIFEKFHSKKSLTISFSFLKATPLFPFAFLVYYGSLLCMCGDGCRDLKVWGCCAGQLLPGHVTVTQPHPLAERLPKIIIRSQTPQNTPLDVGLPTRNTRSRLIHKNTGTSTPHQEAYRTHWTNFSHWGQKRKIVGTMNLQPVKRRPPTQ